MKTISSVFLKELGFIQLSNSNYFFYKDNEWICHYDIEKCELSILVFPDSLFLFTDVFSPFELVTLLVKHGCCYHYEKD